MKSENPFTFVFGKTPKQYITRLSQTKELMDAFEGDNPLSQVFLITGIRGSGKTVFLTDVAKQFEDSKDWIVVHLNPESNLLSALASKLYENTKVKGLFAEKNIGISIAGLNTSVSYASPIIDSETIVEKILKELKRQRKKILITIDEVSSSPQVKTFVSAFQIFVREDYPVFLLMTGLYRNIRNLQDEKTLTFLYRAPKIVLGPLNTAAICNSYEGVFNISKNEAAILTKYTCGYPFAYQVLGYLLWKNETVSVSRSIEHEYDSYLSEFVYEKIWSELSAGDRQVLIAISKSSDNSTTEIASGANIPVNKLSVYRKRLSNIGLIDISKRGYIFFMLPRFKEFIETELALEL